MKALFKNNFTIITLMIAISLLNACESNNKSSTENQPTITPYSFDCNKETPVIKPDKLKIKVIAKYPHHPKLFTQGFYYHKGFIYESSGLYMKSKLLRYPLGSTPDIQNKAQTLRLENNYFAEGLTKRPSSELQGSNEWVQLTWKSGTVFVYQETDDGFSLSESLTIDNHGWGVTVLNNKLVTSDGTATLKIRDSKTLEAEKTLNVTYFNRPLRKLNELETVNQCILANIWQSHAIALINPSTAKAFALVDLTALHQHESTLGSIDVTNGIAYRADNGNLLVTGKYWSHIYEIQIFQKN